MKQFRKTSQKMPAISTASLPDIVFMLLFFFMTVTTIKNEDLLVENVLPKANETESLTKKDRIIEIYVGNLKDVEVDIEKKDFKIQMESKIVAQGEVGHNALKLLSQMPEHLRKVVMVSLKADENVTMGIINDIKQQLQEVNLLKINYTVVDGDVF